MVERNYRMVKRWIAGYIRIYKKCLMQQRKIEYIRLFMVSYYGTHKGNRRLQGQAIFAARFDFPSFSFFKINLYIMAVLST